MSSPSSGTAGATTGTPARRPGVVLAVILITQLMVILDGTVVNIAMPHIQQALHFSPSSLSWVQNAYALAFGGLLLLGARAGDLLGRRRVFITGISVFTLASLLGGLAPNAELLLAARVLQGIGGAIAAPAALTLLMLTYREGPERMKALGYYSLVSSGGGSVGLVLGGMLTDWASWRWGLFVNVPIGIGLVFAARRVLTETEPETGRFDVAGALTSTLGITSLVYGFIRVADAGWTSAEVLVAFAAGVILLVSFVLIERRVSHPIVPLRLFRSADRSAAYLTMLLVVGTMFGMFFFLTQYLQGVLDLSPLAAGLAFLPLTGLLFTASRVVPRLVARIDGAQADADRIDAGRAGHGLADATGRAEHLSGRCGRAAAAVRSGCRDDLHPAGRPGHLRCRAGGLGCRVRHAERRPAGRRRTRPRHPGHHLRYGEPQLGLDRPAGGPGRRCARRLHRIPGVRRPEPDDDRAQRPPLELVPHPAGTVEVPVAVDSQI